MLWGGSFFFNGVVLRRNCRRSRWCCLRVALAAIILLPLLWLYRMPFPGRLVGLDGRLSRSRFSTTCCRSR